MIWFEANAFANASKISYYDYTSTKKEVSADDLANVDFIMYDHDALGLGDNFAQGRLIDSEMFTGCKAQVEENTGMRVLDKNMVRVRKHAAA